MFDGNSEYRLKTEFNEKIRWQINNTGEQAKTAKKLVEDVSVSNDKTSCVVDAEYLGHHFMLCKIVKQGSIANINLRLPLYVR